MGTVVLFGSFDPPTSGHIHLVLEALRNGVDRVFVVPAYGNPWKEGQTRFKERLDMTRRVFSCPPQVFVSDIEGDIARENNLRSVPTWMTLKELSKNRALGDFKILATNETYQEIPRWEKGPEILRDYDFLILSSDHLGEIIPGSIKIRDIQVSSTKVRAELAGTGTSEYLDPLVLDYIKRHHLYEQN